MYFRTNVVDTLALNGPAMALTNAERILQAEYEAWRDQHGGAENRDECQESK